MVLALCWTGCSDGIQVGEEGKWVCADVVVSAVGVEVPGMLSEDALYLDMEAQSLEGVCE